MSRIPPLFFQPLFRDYLWGGRRLETTLGKSLPPGPHWAESWEVVDHGADQSIVADGPWAGRTLHSLIAEFPEQLLGGPATCFPLLFKFLDAQRVLSLQVHPNDAQAATLTPPDLGKTEAWVVLDAAPGAKLYVGLQLGTTQIEFRDALEAGEAEQMMHSFEPSAGDCVLVRAGTPHAIGAGLLVAEIQQASNTTFRLHDWNRVDDNGKPRPLHIEQGLEVLDFQCGPIQPQTPQATVESQRERLVDCDKFVLDRLHPSSTPTSVGGDGRFHILATVSGAAELTWNDATHVSNDSTKRRLDCGATTLIPATTAVQLSAGLSAAARASAEPTIVLDMWQRPQGTEGMP